MSQPTSQSQPSSQPGHRELALEGGTMTVIGLRKKRQKDRFMTLELEFSFTNEKKPRTVGKTTILLFKYEISFTFSLDYPYNDPQFRTAYGHCNNALGNSYFVLKQLA